MTDAWPWIVIALLGVYHGVNPSMGWLFAVALGLQEGRAKAVLKALPPIALGHEASIALAVLLVTGLEVVTAPDLLRPLAALGLIAFGIFKFIKPRSHFRWVGFRVHAHDLVFWSFLMSTAHGAGLMLFPVVTAATGVAHAAPALDHGLPGVDPSSISLAESALAVVLHTGAMLVTMAAVALVVYLKVGVGILRRAWINLDLLWAGVIVLTGVFTLFTG
jgi:hypothetical protein